MKTAFERAVLAEDVTINDPSTPLIRPQRQPGDEGYDEMIDDILEVDDSYMYGAGRSARVRAKRQRLNTELDQYLEVENRKADTISQPELIDHPMDWWHKIGRTRYPLLYKLALDYLSIPSTSCECERCFSTARRTITQDRSSVGAATIEALQLQKNWLLNGCVSSHLSNLASRLKTRERAQVAQEAGTLMDIDDDSV